MNILYPKCTIFRLKEAEDARTLCVSIEGLECSGELATALVQHAEAMTGCYRQLVKMIQDGVDCETTYGPIFEQCHNYSCWYKSRKKVANSMKNARAA